MGDVDEYAHAFIVTLDAIQIYSKFSGSLDLLTPTQRGLQAAGVSKKP